MTMKDSITEATPNYEEPTKMYISFTWYHFLPVAAGMRLS